MTGKTNKKLWIGVLAVSAVLVLCLGVLVLLTQPKWLQELQVKIYGGEQIMPLIGTDRVRLSQDGNVLAVYDGNRLQALNLVNDNLTDLILYDNSMSTSPNADLAITTNGAYAIAIRSNEAFWSEVVIIETGTPTPNTRSISLPDFHKPYRLAISPDDLLLAILVEDNSTGNRQYYAALYSLPDGVARGKIDIFTFGYDLIFAPNGRLAIAEKANIHIWNVSTKKIESSITPTLLNRDGPILLSFSPDGSMLAVSFNATAYGTDAIEMVDVFNVQTGRSITYFSFPVTLSNLPTAFSPDGKAIAISTCDAIHIYRLSDSQRTHTYYKLWEGALRQSCSMSPLQFTPDGKSVYYGWLEPNSIVKFRFSSELPTRRNE